MHRYKMMVDSCQPVVGRQKEAGIDVREPAVRGVALGRGCTCVHHTIHVPSIRHSLSMAHGTSVLHSLHVLPTYMVDRPVPSGAHCLEL